MATSGRPTWYKPDIGLSMRMVLTMFLLGLVYVVFGFILYQVDMPLGFLIVIAGAIAFTQFFFADKIALMAMRAREVSEAEAPQLHEMIGRLAAQSNLPKPRVAIVDTSLPNAFATGRSKNHAVVAVTTGILNKLSAQELEAVLAHELTHIINRDMLVMTIATFFSMVAGLLARNFFWFGGGYGYGRRDSNDNGAGVLIALLASVVVYIVSFVLIRTLSRYRELAADRGAALITGAPANLASALLRISDVNQRIPQRDAREAAALMSPVSALCFVPASNLRGEDVMTLFSSHPSTEERVRRLQEMQAQMEQSQRF
ncbi:MAG TPA: zinc metalloprotease HtpX [Ktedonobacterales bacterium]|nr:zinc metalloprotease HtpX [Ktedonobacterales bacterium]